jgi:acetoin utilization protein AcuC
MPILGEVVPALAETFRPTFLVSQHGCDSHALDPLAHLRLTTNAYRYATVLLDEIAHQWAGGRWLATGGGGYDAYRVVPRSWSLVWLAQAHRDLPERTDAAWRARWSDEAERFGQAPPPEFFLDPPGLVRDDPADLVRANKKTAADALASTVALLEERA